MLTVKKEGILLEKTNLGFENEAVLNPAAIKEGNTVHLFYRAVREGNYSSIGYCKLDGPLDVVERSTKPILFPEDPTESQGIEDPRITKVDSTYYLTYSAYDKINVFGAYATSTDLKTFEKKGIITPKFTYREYKHFIECGNNVSDKYLFHYKLFKEHGLGKELSEKLFVWDKNIMFFPKKIYGKYALIHRLHPGIQIVYFTDFSELTTDFWEKYLMYIEDYIIIDPTYLYESSHIGAGCPPIETEDGWLLIYHAGESTPSGFIYHASAVLLDLENPQKVLGRLEAPFISPTFQWEKEGIVDNIIFPSGAVVFDDILYIYYGAADERIGVASMKLKDLLMELKKENHVYV